MPDNAAGTLYLARWRNTDASDKFLQKALELQQKYGRGRQIDNCIQTNGTLLTDDWCRFFKENNFLVGISIDGPQEFHDEYRRNRQGLPSFYKVMKGIELLKNIR